MNQNIEKLFAIAQKKTRIIIGLMSGTSLDGLDVAMCKISNAGEDTEVVILNFETVDYVEDIKLEIRKVFAKKSGTGFQIGVTKSSNTPVYAATVYELNKTYLCVVKYTLKSGSATDDEVVLYINSTITDKEPTTPTSTTP